MTTDIKADLRADTIQGLRDLADFLEQHPRIGHAVVRADGFFDDAGELRAAIRLTGGWDKRYLPSFAIYTKKFGATVELELNIDRDKVCRRVQTGTKHVDAVEAHDEPVFEWICDDGPETTAEAAAELMSAGGPA